MISYFKIPAHAEERCVSVYVCMYICLYACIRVCINLGPQCNTVLPGACLHRQFHYPAFCTAGLHCQTPNLTTAC